MKALIVGVVWFLALKTGIWMLLSPVRPAYPAIPISVGEKLTTAAKTGTQPTWDERTNQELSHWRDEGRKAEEFNRKWKPVVTVIAAILAVVGTATRKLPGTNLRPKQGS